MWIGLPLVGNFMQGSLKSAGETDITMAGKHYKLEIEGLIGQHMDKSAVSFLWFTSVNW